MCHSMFTSSEHFAAGGDEYLCTKTVAKSCHDICFLKLSGNYCFCIFLMNEQTQNNSMLFSPFQCFIMQQVSNLPGGHARLEAGVCVVINWDSYSDDEDELLYMGDLDT